MATALVAATLYVYGGPFEMVAYVGFTWGLALPLLYTIASLIKFVKPT